MSPVRFPGWAFFRHKKFSCSCSQNGVVPISGFGCEKNEFIDSVLVVYRSTLGIEKICEKIGLVFV